jgi:cytochrome P450
MLASTMLLFLQNPDELEHARADRSLIRTALEESMRLESPVQWLQRIVTENTQLGGVELPKGSLLLVLWGAANRDERKFDEPDRFKADRTAVAKQQMAFGYGIHMCVGAPLARLEGEIAFNRLFDRLASLRLAPGHDLTHIPNMNQRAPTAVHMEFDAEQS